MNSNTVFKVDLNVVIALIMIYTALFPMQLTEVIVWSILASSNMALQTFLFFLNGYLLLHSLPCFTLILVHQMRKKRRVLTCTLLENRKKVKRLRRKRRFWVRPGRSNFFYQHPGRKVGAHLQFCEIKSCDFLCN